MLRLTGKSRNQVKLEYNVQATREMLNYPRYLAKRHNNMIIISYYFDFCPDKPNCDQHRLGKTIAKNDYENRTILLLLIVIIDARNQVF